MPHLGRQSISQLFERREGESNVQAAEDRADPYDPLDRRSDGGSLRPPAVNLTGWLYRPFIDLTLEAPVGNPHVDGLLLAFENVESPSSRRPRLHGAWSPGLRTAIVRRASLPLYELEDPAALPRDLLTPGWTLLLDRLADLPILPEEQAADVLWLLFKLNLYEALDVHSIRLGALTFEQRAIRGLARFAADTTDVADLTVVADRAPTGSWAAVEATYALAAKAGKFDRDVDMTAFWVARHREQVGAYARLGWQALLSRYHRVAAFLPLLRGDQAAVLDELARAERVVEQVKDEHGPTVRSALWETLSKTATLFGDREQAVHYASRYLDESPLAPLAHFAFGRTLEADDRIEDAIEHYLDAAIYGPPRDVDALLRASSLVRRYRSPRDAARLAIRAADLETLYLGSPRSTTRQAADLRGRLEGWSS